MKKSLLAFALGLSICGSCLSAQLPKVAILATGGTIAGTADSSAQMTNYKIGNVTVDTLIKAVPALKDVADLSGEQVANIFSNNMTEEVMLKLAKRINELLAKDDIVGVVVTHGTDTLEETAWFLNLTVNSKKPVIVVGSMRPASALSADGPVNILNAVKLATDPRAKDQGVMIVLNDQINSSRDATKTNTTSMDTFKAPELGYLGYIAGGEPYFFRKTTKRHTADSEFNVANLTSLPRVDILYSHVSDDRALVDASVAAGAKGIVHAGTGNGSIHKDAFKGLVDATKKGVTIVRSSRVGNGVVTPGDDDYDGAGLLLANNLNPQKARILLQLALTKTSDPKEIARIFSEY